MGSLESVIGPPSPCHAIVALCFLEVLSALPVPTVLDCRGVGVELWGLVHVRCSTLISFFTSKGRAPVLPCHMDQGCAWIVK